jgi:membrane protein implicated in regulation of membrane protease activity
MMLSFLHQLTFWDWLALGTVLLIFEVFGAGGYLLWVGIAAAGVGLITFLLPQTPWALQFILFAVLSILSAVLWWKRQRTAAKPSDQPGLNMRGSELLGKEFELFEPISSGRGKIKAGGSMWLVSGPDMPSGSKVRVIGQDGVILRVEAAQA